MIKYNYNNIYNLKFKKKKTFYRINHGTMTNRGKRIRLNRLQNNRIFFRTNNSNATWHVHIQRGTIMKCTMKDE